MDNKSLNIETFNRLLMSAAKDDDSRKEILKIELSLSLDVLMLNVCDLLDELENKGYESELFTKVTNIKDNTLYVFDMLNELEGGK